MLPISILTSIRKHFLFFALSFGWLAALPLRAERHGPFTYRILESAGSQSIEITDYPADAAGSVAIPGIIAGLSVTSIGESAFRDCTGLTSISIPPSVTNIGPSAFRRCTSLASLALPSGLKRISDYSFYVCSNLRTLVIPDTVTGIGTWAFANCSKITSLEIPTNVTQIGPFAFSDCFELAEINLPESITLISDGTFSGCYKLNNITIPTGVTSIGGAAFGSCRNITEILLPLGVTTIGGGAFSNCTRLTNFNFPPGITSLGSGAFRNCSGLARILLPGGLTRIESLTFESCTSLTDIIIPSGVTLISNSAFQYCTGLISVLIHSENLYLRGTAFGGCTKLSSAVFTGNGTSVALDPGVFNGAGGTFSIYYLKGKSGFISPSWGGYPAAMIDEELYPAGKWLLEHGLPYDSGLNQDVNGDGVSLLMAYALNLDPRLMLSGSLPQAQLQTTILSLEFHASSFGITYRVETSSDLIHWTSEGVIILQIAGNGRATASVPRDSGSRYLRLVVVG